MLKIRDSDIEHLQRLKDFKTGRNCLIEKIKSLEDALNESKIPLESSSNSNLNFDKLLLLLHML
jgi:hypothetical protein